MLQGYMTYEVVFLGAMLMAILTTPIATRVARAMRALDQPDARKIHASAIPRLGGIAIVFSVLVLTLPVLALDNAIGAAFRDGQMQFIVIVAGAMFMFVVGLIDDLKGLRARIKLFAQLGAAAAVCASGVRIHSVSIDGLGTWDFGWLSWPITICWIVGVTNALNLIDGLDGLAAGISVIACGVVAVFALYMGQPVMSVLMLAVVGSLLGFLFLNFNPARIFMGDCGSLFLGFIISAASVRAADKAATIVGLALPFVALGVPIFDTLFAILRRTLQRRGIMSPDRGHIHHRLLQRGLKQHQVAVLIYLVTLVTAGLGLFMVFLRGAASLAVFGLILVILLTVFRAVGAVRLKETLVAFRRNRAIAREALQQRQAFEDADLSARDIKTIDQWWQSVCQAADKLEFLRLAIDLPIPDGGVRRMTWARTSPPPSTPHNSIVMTLPLRTSRTASPLRTTESDAGEPRDDRPLVESQESNGSGARKAPIDSAGRTESLKAEIEVYVNGSIESAGRRVALFGRLIDEHSLADLPPP